MLEILFRSCFYSLYSPCSAAGDFLVFPGVCSRLKSWILLQTIDFSGLSRWEPACGREFQVGATGGNRPSAGNFRWEPQVGAGLRPEILGGNGSHWLPPQVGTLQHWTAKVGSPLKWVKAMSQNRPSGPLNRFEANSVVRFSVYPHREPTSIER